jgi:hypothetical protein
MVTWDEFIISDNRESGFYTDLWGNGDLHGHGNRCEQLYREWERKSDGERVTDSNGSLESWECLFWGSLDSDSGRSEHVPVE